jgi:hypothetical protein
MPQFAGDNSGSDVVDIRPEETTQMPARPYRVLHADLRFYSDPKCLIPVRGARLVVLKSEDPDASFHPTECMPSRMRYEQGQTVSWEINKDVLWEQSWYNNPDTGQPERAWIQSVEFTGRVVKS